jgi:hypothetical protein
LLVLYDHHWHDDDRLSNAGAQASALHELYEHQWRDSDFMSVKYALTALLLKLTLDTRQAMIGEGGLQSIRADTIDGSAQIAAIPRRRGGRLESTRTMCGVQEIHTAIKVGSEA